MEYEDFWDSIVEFSNSHESGASDEEPFIVLDEPAVFASDRLLYVLVHPGDLILEGDDLDSLDDDDLRECAMDLCFAAQRAHVAEINELQATHEIDIVVLHRQSSGYAFIHDRYVDDDYRKLFEDAQENRAAILYGDGLPEVADWLVTTCDAARRPAVMVSGCWADARSGCAADIARRLHEAGCRVTLSDAAPTRYLDGDVPRWVPPAPIEPVAKPKQRSARQGRRG